MSASAVGAPGYAAVPPRATARAAGPATSPGDAPAARFDPARGVSREFLQEALSTQVGRAIADKLGAHGVDLARLGGVDVSADATAGRIFSFTTGLLGVFARQNPDLTEAELVDRFESTIRGAVNQGYREAMGILEGMSAFDDSIRGLAEETMRRLDEMFDAYFAALRAQLESARGGEGGA